MKKQKINYKWIELIIIAWTVVFVLVITAVAATTSTYSCFQLSATSSGKVTIEATSTGWTIKAYGTDGSCGSTSTQTVTFTITNTGTNPDGTVRAVNFKITTTGMKTNSTAEAKTLDATTTKLTYTATSGKGSANYAEITINFADIVQASTGTSVTTTVIPKVGGKITVDGTAVTAKTDFANADDHTYSLTATADSGYTFIGWMSADGALNTDGVGTLSYSGQNAGTLWPLFLKSDSAMYQIKGASPMLYYAYLDEAITAAGNSGTIVVNKSGAAYHSDSTKNSFTIPSGVTLLIPYDDANTLVTKGNEVLDAYNAAVVARSEYRALTMPANTKITVASGGAISISSGRANQFIGQVGPYGAIYMDSGSNITVQSGGTLYAWGYIFHGTKDSGGSVEVESGGTVYEPISIMDYPGSSSLTTTLTDNKVFPMRSYSIRNVEVPMTLNRGAKEYVFTCLYGSNFLVGTNPLYALLIADGVVNDETPVFQNSGTITKSYANKRMIFSINGDCQLNSFTVEVSKSAGTYKISSSATTGFYIPSCWDITLTSGTTKVNDNVIMCEGSTFTVDQGATINANEKNIYVLDADNDPGAVSTSNGCGIDVQNVHGNYYTNVPKDAVLDVNGTLIASGGFYTSAAGACITSSKSGGEIQVSGTSASASVNVKTTNTYEAINFSAAKLKNVDNNYTETSGASGTYTYIKGYWHLGDDHTYESKVTIEPTCAKKGETTYTCKYCPESYPEEISAKGHTWNAATCTAPKTCSVCGATEGEAAGHNMGEWSVVTEPSCEVTGKEERSCSACDYSESREIAAAQHNYTSKVTVPTCTESGYTTHTCSKCGNSYQDSYVDAMGHSYGGDNECDNCGAVKVAQVVTPSSEGSSATTTEHTSLQGAVSSAAGTNSVVQLIKPADNTTPSTESCTISGSKNVYIDIAGNNVTVGVAEGNSGGVIYGIDSSTDKFGTPQTSVTIAAGSNVTVAPVTLDPTTGNMYISKTTTDTTTGTVTATFHRVAAKARDYYIEARADGTAAIGISLGFKGDESLDQLENIGFDIYTGSDENTQLETVWLKGEQDASGESIQITNDTTYWVKQLAANTPNAYGDYHVYGLIKADGDVYITKTALTFNFKTVLDENWPKENATNYTESNNVLQSFYQINGLTRTIMEKEET